MKSELDKIRARELNSYYLATPTIENMQRMAASLADVYTLLKALDILAAICADATRVDPDEFHSSRVKSRQDCWAEYSIKKAMDEDSDG